MRGRAVKNFHFVEVINEWPLNGKIIETRARIWSFWFAHFMYQSYLRLIIYRFQSHLLLLVYKLYSFVFGFRPVWPNGWVFVQELSGSGFESSCSHSTFRFRACFEQGVPWHSDNYRVWIHSETRTWHDKNIQLKYSNLHEVSNLRSQLLKFT